MTQANAKLARDLENALQERPLQGSSEELKLRICELEQQCEKLRQDKARQQRIMCEVKKTQEQTNIRFEQFKLELDKIDSRSKERPVTFQNTTCFEAVPSLRN